MGVEEVMSRRCAGWQRPIPAAILMLAAAIACTSSKPARVVQANPASEQASLSQPGAGAQSGRGQTTQVAAMTPAAVAPAAGDRQSAAEIRTLELREGAPEVFVDLEATSPLVWTSFRNPEGKVVIELPNAVPSVRVQDLNPEEGLVSSVKVQRETEGSRPMTRLVISTRHEVEHSVTADGLHLQIRLLPLEAQAKVVAREPAKQKLAFEPVPPAPAAPPPPPAPAAASPGAATPTQEGVAAPAQNVPGAAPAPSAPAVAGAATPDEPAVAPAPTRAAGGARRGAAGGRGGAGGTQAPPSESPAPPPKAPAGRGRPPRGATPRPGGGRRPRARPRPLRPLPPRPRRPRPTCRCGRRHP